MALLYAFPQRPMTNSLTTGNLRPILPAAVPLNRRHCSPQFHPVPASLCHCFPSGAVCRSACASDLDLKGPRSFYVSKARTLSLGTIVRPPGSVAQKGRTEGKWKKGDRREAGGRKDVEPRLVSAAGHVSSACLIRGTASI